MSSFIAKRDSMEVTVDAPKTELQSAHLIESSPKKRALGLVDLPAAVRNCIYKYALDTELVNVGESNVSYTHYIKDGTLQFTTSRSPFLVQTALFYVNKQISKEALHYFYSKNLFVKFKVYSSDARHAKTMLEDSGLLFSTASPEWLERSKQHALEVVVVEKNSSQMRAEVMFPAQYLPRIINFFDQCSQATKSWAPAHSIFISMMNTYDFPISRLQGDLLELFRLLSNLGNAAIDNKHLLDRYAEGLQSNMTAPAFNANTWLETVMSLADLADTARDKEDYITANEYSQSVIIALTYGYLTHAEILHTQDEAFAKSVQRLRWRTELGLGIALSLLHREYTLSSPSWLSEATTPAAKTAARDLLLAESTLSKALSLATDSPSPTSNPWFLSLPVELIPPNKPTFFTDLERAHTWYALGTVHASLGETLFAAGDMERALELWKDGEGKGKAEKAFEGVRERIDSEREGMWKGEIRPGRGLGRAARIAIRV
ncbi:hypothetical protein BDU57DRAFT_450424 [Ampelomyces quisqualis]|uniref:Uncharacterized protein n=1 Tax=Ampelomyces quisqualis TaxID=50730 RepID=A0A6A5QP51_AMPQU|nr:hypothetical protein BDU57DRAFT_450424 [Ampelomyces quisqualis]